MRRIRILLLLVSIVPMLSACASAGAGSGEGSRNPDVLLAEEIETQNFTNALEAVQRLRPQWMRRRGAGPDPIMVYVDGVRFGESNDLQSIPISNVERLEWVDASTATQRWGTGNTAGAIAVTSRRGR